MTTDSMTMESDATLFLGEAWFDPIEAGIREQIRGFIEGLIEEELTVALGRRRYERGPGETTAAGSAAAMPSRETAASPTAAGYRHGRRQRRIIGSFGTVEIAGADRWCGREGMRVEEQGVAPLRPPDQAGGGADRRNLSRRHQYPAGAPGVGGAVQGGDRQGHGQPHLAEGEDGLGSLVEAPARRGRHRPADPRRHRRARPARQKGDVDLIAGCPRRPSRRAEGAARREEHGWRERGRLAGAARRSRRPRAEDARAPDHRRRRRPRESAGG